MMYGILSSEINQEYNLHYIFWLISILFFMFCMVALLVLISIYYLKYKFACIDLFLLTDEIVALKRLKMEKEKEGFPITSLREINTLLKSQHMNIVTVRVSVLIVFWYFCVQGYFLPSIIFTLLHLQAILPRLEFAPKWFCFCSNTFKRRSCSVWKSPNDDGGKRAKINGGKYFLVYSMYNLPTLREVSKFLYSLAIHYRLLYFCKMFPIWRSGDKIEIFTVPK